MKKYYFETIDIGDIFIQGLFNIYVKVSIRTAKIRGTDKIINFADNEIIELINKS